MTIAGDPREIKNLWLADTQPLEILVTERFSLSLLVVAIDFSYASLTG